MQRRYLDGTQIRGQMDHDSLKWILDLTEATSQSACCRFHHFERYLGVVHLAGNKHKTADTLSRLQTAPMDTDSSEDKIPEGD